MSQGLGPDFDRAQREYDNRLPEDDPPIELECERCKMRFEASSVKERYCSVCLEELARKDEGDE